MSRHDTIVFLIVDEHSLIRNALESLSLAIEKIENEEHVPVTFFEIWLEFYRNFIVNYHHFKEEHIMFKELGSEIIDKNQNIVQETGELLSN